MNQLKPILASHSNFTSILPFNLNREKLTIFDLSANNKTLSTLNFKEKDTFNKYISNELKKNHSRIGIGKYNEERIIYQWSELFDKSETARTIHLGIDLWADAGTAIFSPLDGTIHSFQDNNNAGDYGPTIILQHQLSNITFYTLYGHLSRESLNNLYPGKKIKQGEKFAQIGTTQVNGNWPPHLHFQIIADMLGKKGDYPGVCTKTEREKYLELCPDPNLILKIKEL